MSGSHVRSRRGIALMLVLWLIVVLGAVAAGVTASLREETAIVDNLRVRSAARYAAESGVLVARLRIEALLREATHPDERAGAFADVERRLRDLKEADAGGARFAVAVADLNARIDLNHAEPATLRNFLRQFASEREASAIASAIEDWRDPDDVPRPGGAEAAEYARAGSPFEPANSFFDRLEEIRRVRGMSDALANAIAPHVTVDGDGRININSATDTVLAALPGIGPEGARRILARRAAGERFGSAAVIEQIVRRGGRGGGVSGAGSVIAGSRTSTVPSRILIVSRGWRPGHPLTHEIQAIFAVAGTRLTLRQWRERDL